MNGSFEAVGAHYEASARGDLDGMLAPLTAASEWIEMAGSTYAGTYVGTEAIVAGVFARIGADWDGFAFTLERLVDGGATVVAIGAYSGTYKKTGRKMSARVVHVWDMDGGKAVRFEQFADTALIDAAAR